jgi:hypothetical protein
MKKTSRMIRPAFMAFICASTVLMSCSASTNIMGILTPDQHKKTYENMMAIARATYDNGDFETALAASSQALKLIPGDEDASILYGYVNLALIGIDPFSLTKKLIEIQKDNQAGDTTSLLDGSTKDTSDVLSSLQEILGIREGEIELLGTIDTTDPELPLLIPKCAEETREVVTTLSRVQEAIYAACPFVDDAVKVRSDARQLCKPSTQATGTQTAKAHFLWAFAHLTEALAFNAVLTWTTKPTTPAKTNLEQRVEKVRSGVIEDPSQLTTFIDSVVGLERTVSAIFPTSAQCSTEWPTSQLKAMLNDMLAVNLAFAKLPGVPTKITGSNTKAMAKIQGIQSSTAGDSSTKQTVALKSQFTKKLASALESKMNDLHSFQGDAIPEDQREELCRSWSSIAGSGETKRPTLCGEG